MRFRMWAVVVAAALLHVAAASPAHAQYFGRNKVQYRTFDFKILKTQHFDLYYYPEEAEAAQIASRLAERWYARLSRFFSHQLRGRQVIILYAAPAQFRQTNAVEDLIGEGTGGLTEVIKRRIVLPMSGSLADTDHVLGHELVHAFQFDMTGTDLRETTAEVPDILQFPLWFVEGMAEYITLGAVDAQTAMWLRDAALREKLPHIKDLENPRYFPYRWGHAFWAYVGAKYGDRAVASLLRSGANPRVDLPGLALQLGTTPDDLTNGWHVAIRRSATAAVAEALTVASDSRLVISESTGSGRYNLGPRLSPDGKEIAFFSERSRFAIDLYVADAATGKQVRRLSSSATDPHFDSLEFLNSAGAWSPDSRTLAIAATRRGRPIVALLDSRSGSVRRELALPGLDDVLNPVYSPDGQVILFSGNRGGLIDLYRITLDSGAVEQLTKDAFADLEPTFAPNGRTVVFVTERFSTNLDTLESGPLRLAQLDLVTRQVQLVSGFLGGKHLSPQVSGDGRYVTFLADPDGISNLYRMPIDGGPVTRLSSYLTGVAGITSASPALSLATTSGRLAFSVFEDGGHAIYVMDESEVRQTVAPPATRRAALLPGRDVAAGEIQTLLADVNRGLPGAQQPAQTEHYPRKLQLDMISQPYFTAGVSSFGTYVSGGISMSFSDMLGDRLLGLSVQAGGAFADIGGALVYVNRQRRWNWMMALESLPYRSGVLAINEVAADNQILVSEIISRQTVRGLTGTVSYPLNVATRVEFSGGLRQHTFGTDVRTRVYNYTTGEFIEQTEAKLPSAPSLYLADGRVALVNDTALFGATSPIYGARSRLEVGQSLGTMNYTTVLADVRRYFMPVRPVTIAVRASQYSRWGRDNEHPQLVELYAGYPELVHGYGLGSFDASDCEERNAGGTCAVFNNLRGSGLVVGNIEVRAPLFGLLKGEIDYGRVPIEIAGFFDAGLVWTTGDRPTYLGGTRQIVQSVGAAARVNLFGLFILEIAASHPFDRTGQRLQWQVGFRQGF